MFLMALYYFFFAIGFSIPHTLFELVHVLPVCFDLMILYSVGVDEILQNKVLNQVTLTLLGLMSRGSQVC